jgi:glycosyltransferase involved in cell wall biosynthesis
MRIVVCHPQTPFVRGGAEMHTEALVRALRDTGHDAEIVAIPAKWYPATELLHEMAVWRSLDLSESNGLKIEAVIALKFPAYLVPHERKIVWLIHQHRSAYELWDHPEFADLSKQEEGPAVRDMVWQSDRLALGEAKCIYANSRNVRQRLWASLRLSSKVLYHPSPITEVLLGRPPGPYGDFILFPSRLEALKRQSLAVEAMRHVRTSVQLILAGGGPDEPRLREQARRRRLSDRVRFVGRVSDEHLYELYLSSLAVYYGPFDEDYGYVTLEGFAAHRAVVTLTDSGGPLEMVEDGHTGLVTPPEPKAIAAAFDRLYKDRALAERLGHCGNKTLRATVPPWADIVAQLLES